jgi:hypothetical protein
MISRHVHRAERIVEDEHPYARLCAFPQYRAERVGHPTRRAVVQLQRNRALCGAQVVPQAGIRLVAIQEHFDARARSEPGSRRHGRHQGKLRLAHADRRAVSRHAANMTNRRSPREMKEADQRQAEHDDP